MSLVKTKKKIREKILRNQGIWCYKKSGNPVVLKCLSFPTCLYCLLFSFAGIFRTLHHVRSYIFVELAHCEILWNTMHKFVRGDVCFVVSPVVIFYVCTRLFLVEIKSKLDIKSKLLDFKPLPSTYLYQRFAGHHEMSCSLYYQISFASRNWFQY